MKIPYQVIQSDFFIPLLEVTYPKKGHFEPPWWTSKAPSEKAYLSFFWGCEYLLCGPGCLGIVENVIHVLYSYGHVWYLNENIWIYMGVSKNRGTPKWMVYNRKPY